MSTLPLDDIKVVEFGQALAAPVCTQYLADFGADVIKVERPAGELARRWGTARYGATGDRSGLFVAANRNKKSVVVDLGTSRGVDVAVGLAAQADVVVENFPPGVADRLSVGYRAISSISPDVIYCSVSGFGQTGPMAPEKGFEGLLQAYGGALSITGEEDAPAVRIGPSVIDSLTGAHAAIGILVALAHRARTGRGQLIDTSLYDASLFMMSYFIADFTGTGVLPRRSGSRYPWSAPYGVFETADGEVFLGMSSEVMWREFVELAGYGELARDRRFATNADRVRHSEQLYEILVPAFRSRSTKEWLRVAADAGVPSSSIETLADVVKQPQAASREMIVPSGVDDVRVAGIPIKLSASPGVIQTPAPALGHDTEAVLLAAGYSREEVARLAADGVVMISR